MNKAIVLGTGPGLLDPRTWDADAEDRFRIGVNRSFDMLWAPIGVTADERFWENEPGEVMRHAPVKWLYREHFPKAPYWTKGNSGAFGLWVAKEMGFWDIRLAGFGGKGHFYGTDDEDRTELNRKLHIGIMELSTEGCHISGPLPPVPDKILYRRVRAI